MLLSVENLDVCYGQAKALHGVSMQVDDGELVCVVGRNGAGKTTLLKTVGGFLKPARGDILFQGAKIDHSPPEKLALKGIRYVFQDKRVFADLTVRDNIELAAYPVGESLDRAIRRVVDIHPKMEKLLSAKARGLSGGERQILLIGRALIGEPRLLLIDEPTEGIAAKIIGEIVRVLQAMKGKIAMVVVEQNLKTVSRLADRVYVMKEGTLFREITDPEVIREPSRYENDL